MGNDLPRRYTGILRGICREKNCLFLLQPANAHHNFIVPYNVTCYFCNDYQYPAQRAAAVLETANWRIIFRFLNEDVHLVDYLDYH
jgi:hypothetical protein